MLFNLLPTDKTILIIIGERNIYFLKVVECKNDYYYGHYEFLFQK